MSNNDGNDITDTRNYGGDEHAVRLHREGYAVEQFDLGSCSDYARVRFEYNNNLSRDPAVGNRWRQNGKVRVNPNGSVVALGHGAYRQYDNQEFAGVDRRFEPIKEELLKGSTLSRISRRTAAMWRELHAHEGPVDVGLHLIRYQPEGEIASFSTPIWLHRDDERLVLVTVVARSPNLGGGESVVTRDPKTEVRGFHLHAWEGLWLTRDILHAVTIHTSMNGQPAYRDIVISTVA